MPVIQTGKLQFELHSPSLFGIEVSTEAEMDAVLKEFDDEEYLLLNSALLPFQGIGENNFSLNEWLADGVSLLDFETLGDYARDDHEFQEQARKKKDPAYEVRPYQGDLHPCWARLNIDGEDSGRCSLPLNDQVRV